MNYGYFDDDRREYVITNPKPPAPWTNYVGTLAFGGLVDHTGGSLICKGDPALNRIVKYLPQLPGSSFNGETLYIRLKTDDGYEVFSPFFAPTLTKLDKYECRVGLSYQKFVSEAEGIRTEVTVFVPPGESVVLRDITVTNIGSDATEIDVIPVIEYSHFDGLKQFTNADWVPQTMMVDAEQEDGGLVTLKQYAFMKKDSAINYFTSNHAVDSFQTDRAKFLGDNGYGSWANPLELQNDSLSNYEARRGDVVSALLHKLGRVEAGHSVRLVTLLGQDTPTDIDATIAKFRDENNVDTAFGALADYWDDYLSVLNVDTPDESMNSMVNIHNPRQCQTTFNWSRYLSLYQLGLGARGLGFRDSSQDVMGVIASIPNDAKGLLKKLISIQRPDGSAMHQFFPLTMEANMGDSRESEEKDYYGDDHLWIVIATCAYLRETGDYEFLKEEITFYNEDLAPADREPGTVLDHLQRSLAFTKNNVGAHGLPLLGFADWNDTVNLKGKAESMFNACLYGRGLNEMIKLMQFQGDTAAAEQYAADHAAMKAVVNEHCWDGEWYVRYYEEDGTPVGSRLNTEGQIYTNAQSWPILAGYATEERMAQALESVNGRLNTAFGIKLSAPGYNGFDPAKGGVTTYPPGAKENGGIFLHSNPWVMIAETIAGNGDRAFQYYDQINPASKNDIIDRYECEPYCYPQNILGDEHPQFGLARNSWLSGTASWTYQASTQYILGIRPEHEGLSINPCIPRGWDGFTATRKYRNATYKIQVSNPNGVSKGVAKCVVDGEEIAGHVAPEFADRGEHTVEITLVPQTTTSA